MSVKKLNLNNFEDEILKRDGVAIVDFYADWCGPCKMVAPVLDRIAEEREDVTVGKVNVDLDGELAAQYGVMSIPTLVIFKDGKEINRSVGAKNKAGILALLG
ncbi:MAG: thioredoxin [Clostridia bacterium]|nr:thioredoxin [Clostridia bacterium]